MSKKTEKIKQIALAVVAVVFVITFYMTFFKNKSGPQPAPPRSVPAASPSSVNSNTPLNTQPVNKPLPLGKEAAIAFQYPIRDIFKPQLSPSTSKQMPAIKKTAPKPLSQEEIQAIRDKLTFKGAILNAGHAVAIIDNGFFHVGDTIGPYKIVSISDRNVRIDTFRGIVTLEMIHHE